MQQEIRFFDFFEGCFEAFDEVRRQILDKSNSIGEQNLFSNPECSEFGVKGCKELIGYIGFFIRESSEKGRFSCIRISDQRNRFEASTFSPLALISVILDHFFEFFLYILDLSSDVTLFLLDAFFPGSTCSTNSPAFFVKQTRLVVVDLGDLMFELGELDLELGFLGFRVLFEDFENDIRAVPDRYVAFSGNIIRIMSKELTEMLDLCRFEEVVDDDDVDLVLLGVLGGFSGFTGAEIGFGRWPAAVLENFIDDNAPIGFH